MNILVTAYLCALAAVYQSGASCNLPFTKRCKASDSKLSECWKTILEEVPQYLRNGIQEFDIPPIDPWRSKGQYTAEGDTYTLGHRNMEHGGTKYFEVIDTNINLPSNLIILKLRFPKLHHTCTTFTNGTLLGYQFLGKDGCNEAKADSTILFVLKGKRINVEGKEHIDFDSIDITVRGKYTHAKFQNIIAGGSEENNQFSGDAQKAAIIFAQLYNKCIRLSLAHDIATAIKNVYKECPLNDLHPH